jgi:hypothetical protein
MSAGAFAALFTVPFFGALFFVLPAVTKPTVQFGVRIPPERTGATVIGDQRRAYYWRTACPRSPASRPGWSSSRCSPGKHRGGLGRGRPRR